MNILIIDPSVGTGDGLNTGLGWLASSLEASGHGARILDLVNRGALSFEDTVALVRKNIDKLHPDMIGFCIHSITLNVTVKLAKAIKEFSKKPLIFGGPQMAFEKENIFQKIPELDFAMSGESEKSLARLMSVLQSGGKDLSGIGGLFWKKNGGIVQNPVQGPVDDINVFPFPNYAKHFGLKKIGSPYPVMTSRGCPYSCIFCNSFMSGKKWRTRNIDNVMDELEFAMNTYGIKEFMVQEPVFNLKPERVIEFCDALRKRNISMPWFSPSGVRADRLTPESLEAMKKSGCTEVKIGVESLVPEVLKNANKGVTVEKITEVCRMIRKSSFPLRGSFIIGLPGDNYERTMENFRRSQELEFETTDWSLLIPYPGTKAYEWVLENGRMFYDYCSADQGAFQVTKPEDIKLAFDTADYPAEDRIKAFVKISVRSGNYIFDRNQSKYRIAATLLSQILRHDIAHLPRHLAGIYRKMKMKRKRGPSKSDRYLFSELAPF